MRNAIDDKDFFSSWVLMHDSENKDLKFLDLIKLSMQIKFCEYIFVYVLSHGAGSTSP